MDPERPRRPASVGQLTERVLRQLRPDDTDLALVAGAWTAAVGDAVAAHAVPVGVRDGVLHVRCDSGIWASELRSLGNQLLERLRAGAPSVRLRGLRTSIGRIEVAVAAPEQPAAEPAPPPSAVDRARAREAAASVEDPALRASLERAMLATRPRQP
jgi:predicted nucleic acid-binding Zn ribbon protein